VQYLYLTVNDDNTKAKKLYAKQGFVHASQRAPAMSILAYPQLESNDILVERVSPEEALRLTSEAYKEADLTLADLKCLFDSPLYEGTFVARQGDSYAGVSAWNGSSLTGFKIERLLLPITWWRNRIVKPACAVATASSAWYWSCLLSSAVNGARASPSWGTWTLLFVLSGLTASGLFFLWKAWPMLRFVAGKLLSTDTKLRHRMFGQFAHGPIDEQGTLMRAALRRVHNTARADGYGMSICNMDKQHPLRSFFPSSKFTTTFLYKPVGKDAAKECRALSVDSFFDPRDL
jgi:hypothetical protein